MTSKTRRKKWDYQFEKDGKDVTKSQEPFAPLPENVDLFWRPLSVGHLPIISDFKRQFMFKDRSGSFLMCLHKN